ncbi:MAG: polysaccharide deacetylase family protein [Ruminococcus sp.]|uniref:polysaccharide deacetylase family protein n=1 Tax=Ruminococcus sp. TaxID=41978 RepID=UPI0025D4B59C|nr:polysaccharide deacetylase family protein [Ruminococcus sp.]MCR4793866.1 polysaccharide deacetylase family protein [Ruminococcus sp.]
MDPHTNNKTDIQADKKLCAISFDDGAAGNAPTDPSMRILKALIKNKMTATFFYVSDWTKNAGGIEEVKFAYKNGMEVANHSISHPYLSKLDTNEIREQWEQCNTELRNIIAAEPSHIMRPPYLDVNENVLSALCDIPLISCAIDTRDWDNATTEQIVNTIKKAAQDGSLEGAIVLCHETYASTAAAMEEVLPWLALNGYKNVNISDMAKAHGKALANGQLNTHI